MIKAIIFDCDGVLVDSEIVGLEECALFLQTHGFSWTGEDLIREFTGMHVGLLREKFTAQYAKILGRLPSEDEVQALLAGFIEQRRSKRHLMTTVPGTEIMAASLKDLDLQIGVASSSQAHFLEDKMRRYELWPHFAPHIYSADLVNAGKPEPDIFLYTAEQMNIAPPHCLVIEDSVHGITAAKAAGMEVWGFTGGGHCFEGHGQRLQDAGAAKIIADHSQLMQAFQRLLSQAPPL